MSCIPGGGGGGGGGATSKPPRISAPSHAIFKMLVFICSSGFKEYTYKILLRSGKNYAFYGSSKKIGTRGRSNKGYIEKKLKMVRIEFFFQNYLQNMKLKYITKKLSFQLFYMKFYRFWSKITRNRLTP